MSFTENILSQDFKVAVQRGEVPGWSLVHKFGYNPEVDTTTDPEDVWSFGGVYQGFLASDAAVEIVSTSGNDTAAGSGAQKVLVTQMLDASGNVVADEEITLNGTTAVTLTNNISSCTRMYITDVGSSSSNEGRIDLQTSIGGTVLASIPIGKGQTQQAIYRVPNDKTLYVIDMVFSIRRLSGAAGSAEVTLFKRAGTGKAWRAVRTEQLGTTFPYNPPNTFETFSAGEQIRAEVSTVSDNDTACTVEFGGYLVDD